MDFVVADQYFLLVSRLRVLLDKLLVLQLGQLVLFPDLNARFANLAHID